LSNREKEKNVVVVVVVAKGANKKENGKV
jgi:hypothetical protein